MLGYSVRLGLLGILLFLSPSAARAQAYEAIGFCKRNTGILLACIVAEKIGDTVIEKVVERTLQEWWSSWESGAGQEGGTPPAGDGSEDAAAREIAATGVDYRTLMQDLGELVPGSPSSLGETELITTLATACTSASRMICGEFSPLFPGLAPASVCDQYADETTCRANPGCHWRFNLCVPSGG